MTDEQHSVVAMDVFALGFCLVNQVCRDSCQKNPVRFGAFRKRASHEFYCFSHARRFLRAFQHNGAAVLTSAGNFFSTSATSLLRLGRFVIVRQAEKSEIKYPKINFFLFIRFYCESDYFYPAVGNYFNFDRQVNFGRASVFQSFLTTALLCCLTVSDKAQISRRGIARYVSNWTSASFLVDSFLAFECLIRYLHC
ncbi:hypothetical protein T07_12453 [Trichinella nelsoni]|uniref:Uncharacterized protein n=1 Tax=Trichinella nelsoni TaxID=6336 RepID=A0A0V0RM53_9BILA|nr:hypothetical protein T07_12453 [Trichinella nelsoni]